MRRFKNPAVAQAFQAYPAPVRRKLMALRELIFAIAAETDGVGELEETLKWSEPAYVTSESGSGSTIRVAARKADPKQYAMYFNCNTTLVESFRKRFAEEFEFEGNRAIVFDESETIPTDALTFCIAAALTYHRKKSPTSRRQKIHREQHTSRLLRGA